MRVGGVTSGWSDYHNVVHELHSYQSPNYSSQVRLKCGRWTPSIWWATDEPITCLECVVYVPAIVRVTGRRP